jgi:hypothetical protein
MKRPEIEDQGVKGLVSTGPIMTAFGSTHGTYSVPGFPPSVWSCPGPWLEMLTRANGIHADPSRQHALMADGENETSDPHRGLAHAAATQRGRKHDATTQHRNTATPQHRNNAAQAAQAAVSRSHARGSIQDPVFDL